MLCVLALAPLLLAAPLRAGTPQLSLRVEGLFGQPTTQLGARGGAGVGAAWRLTDQVSLLADLAQRAARGGGIGSAAVGLQATLDATPISPYLELSVAQFTNRSALGYSLATRTGAGADWQITPRTALGLVVRTYTPFDPESGNSALAGLEAALRLVFTPGAK
ncbi:MAG: hypothetical protein E6J78_11140 [Deltaproteobacteria bacterium]|nr:MAG: hypothetical protein E6J78_11140 [Deltaproteobacteria bacterium]